MSVFSIWRILWKNPISPVKNYLQIGLSMNSRIFLPIFVFAFSKLFGFMRWIRLLLIFSYWISYQNMVGQCDFAYHAIDEFDSTLIAATQVVNVGNIIPSYFETTQGPKMVEEGKIFFSYTEEAKQDSGIVSFFLSLGTQEYEYYSIENGENVLIALSDSTIVGLYNIPESGFDRTTNMRQFTHTCVLPVDIFYKLVYFDIMKIRIRYKEFKHDIELYPQQREELKEMLRCIGRAAGLYPLKP